MKEPKLELLTLDGEAETVRENNRRMRLHNVEMQKYNDYVNYVTTEKRKPVLQVSESPNDNMAERQNIIYRENYNREMTAYNQWLRDREEFFNNQTAKAETKNNG